MWQLALLDSALKTTRDSKRKLIKNKLFTSVTEGQKFKVKGTNNKVESFEMVRDLFGSILVCRYNILQR